MTEQGETGQGTHQLRFGAVPRGGLVRKYVGGGRRAAVEEERKVVVGVHESRPGPSRPEDALGELDVDALVVRAKHEPVIVRAHRDLGLH